MLQTREDTLVSNAIEQIRAATLGNKLYAELEKLGVLNNEEAAASFFKEMSEVITPLPHDPAQQLVAYANSVGPGIFSAIANNPALPNMVAKWIKASAIDNMRKMAGRLRELYPLLEMSEEELPIAVYGLLQIAAA